MAGHEAAISKDLLPFGHPSLLRTDFPLPEQIGIIKTLFDTLLDAAHTKADWKLFPSAFQERLAADSKDKALVRTVTDYIASMTEKEAKRQFHTLTGVA